MTLYRSHDPTPYRHDDWPLECGFVYDADACLWRLGDFRLKQLTRRAWRLHRGQGDFHGELITTLRRDPEAVALSLAAKLREKTRTPEGGAA